MKKFFDKNVAFVALAVALLQYILSAFVYPLLSITTTQVFSINAATALGSPTIGTQLVALLSGIIPLTLSIPTVLLVYASVYLLVFAGWAIYDMNWAPKGKSETSRIFLLLLYGTVVFYLLLLAFNMGTVATLGVPLAIALAINYAIIAFVVSLFAKKVKVLRI